MKQKMFSLLLISNFTIIFADSIPDATTPTTKKSQPLSTKIEQLNRYIKCITLINLQEPGDNEKTATPLKEQIKKNHCFGEEFKLFLEFSNNLKAAKDAKKNLDKYHEILAKNAGISDEEFDRIKLSFLSETVNKLNS